MNKDDILVEYYKTLNVALNSQESSFLFNKDRAHNATIMRFMFEKSTEVNMYCGKMSVFRESFYNKIRSCESDETKNAELAELAKETKTKLLESMTEFFSREGTILNIILENYNKEYLEDLIDHDLIMSNIKRNKIRLYMLSDNLTFKRRIFHFSYSDKPIVRFEQSKEEHSAVCSINDSKLKELSEKTFSNLLKFAVPVDNARI